MQLMEAVSLFIACLEFTGFFTDNIVDGSVGDICQNIFKKKMYTAFSWTEFSEVSA